MEQNVIKGVPYGVSDFETVRTDNLYYVDKTMYLPKLDFRVCCSIMAC